MARLLVLAASAPLFLIGAAYPGDKPPAPPPGEMAYSDQAPIRYRPCRPGPGDDRCIQLYERGVPAAYARWRRTRDQGQTEVAMGGPEEPVAPSRPRYHERPDRHHGEAGYRRHRCDRDDSPAEDDYGDEARGM